MATPFGIGETDESDEAFDESDEAFDEAFDEAIRRSGRRPPVQTAARQSAYRQRPNNDFVTQAQLQAALARVSGQIATNSTAIKTVDGRVRTVSSEQARLTSALRKEIADRKKEEDGLRKDIQSTRELAAILPLIAKNNPMISLLALGGGSLFGGSGTGTGALGGDSTSNLLLLALVLSGGKLFG
jgi:hypothetical protein